MDLFQKLYNGGPEIRAIKEKASEIAGKAASIKSAADKGNLSGPATDLDGVAQTLNSSPTVANAKAFKVKYDAFSEAYNANEGAQSAVQSYWNNLKKIIDEDNLTEENKRLKFYSIIVPSIVTHLSYWTPSTKYVFHGVDNSKSGMGGWKKYEYGFGNPKTPVDASFYHAFDILLVIKISLAVIFIYSLHYRNNKATDEVVLLPKPRLTSTILTLVIL